MSNDVVGRPRGKVPEIVVSSGFFSVVRFHFRDAETGVLRAEDIVAFIPREQPTADLCDIEFIGTFSPIEEGVIG